MAIAFRNSNSAGGASGGNITITKPTGTVDNDILIAFLYDEVGADAWTLPAGWAFWSENTQNNLAQFRGAVAWKRASSEGADYTFTLGGTAWRTGIIMAFSGAITSGDPLDCTVVTNTAFTTTVIASSITNATANSMNVAGVLDYNEDAIGVASSGYTLDGTLSTVRTMYALQASSGASGSKTFSSSSANGNWLTIHVSIKEAPTAAVEQEGFRFGVDDGSESAHTWEAAQDTNVSTASPATKLLRVLLNATADPAAMAYKLKFQKNGAGGYATVATSATSAGTTPLIEAADATESGNDTATNSWALSTPNASTGDLLIFCLSWDDSTATTDVTEPAGKNSEVLSEINATPATDASTETRSKVWYTVCTGAWTSGTLTFTPSASESWTGCTIRVPAGEFDSATPIGGSVTAGAAATNETNVQHGAFTAGATDGSGKLCVWTSADVDPQTVASGFTQVANTDRGTVSGGFFHRNTAVSNSESISATTVSTIASDSWSSVAFVVRAPIVTNDLYISTSANIAAGGEDTTARLTAPASKTTADFVTGRRWDNENGSDSLNITTDDYTEVEWCLTFKTGLAGGDYFDFRVYNSDAALDTYTVTPRWTVSTGISGVVTQTQASDTPSSTATLKLAAVVTQTQAGDTSTATGTLAIVGTLTQTQAGDTITATGTGAVTTYGVVDQTQAGDTAASTGTLQIQGITAQTQAGDTVTSTGELDIAAVVAQSQAGDTLTSTAALSIKANADQAQADNTVTATGTLSIAAVVNQSQADNVTITTGALSIYANTTAAQDDNTITSTGVGTASTNGVVVQTQDNNTSTATGTLDLAADGTLTQADNAPTITATLALFGAVGIAQDDNTGSITGELDIQAVVNASQADNTMTAYNVIFVPDRDITPDMRYFKAVRAEQKQKLESYMDKYYG